MNYLNSFTNIKAILSDVAGTTTSISFINEVLFKYVIENIHSFLSNNWENEDVRGTLSLIIKDNCELEKAVEIIKNKTIQNENNAGLKKLQGLIYREGYEKGSLKSQVFPDVAECFKSWHEKFQIAIYSTGSVESQKLFFSNTDKGDLTTFISYYFDLTNGLKCDAESYKKISDIMKLQPSEILYLTDLVSEADAAYKAGCKCFLITRPGNKDIPKEVDNILIVSSFNQIKL